MEISKYKQALSHLLKDDPLKNITFNSEARLIDNDPKPVVGFENGGRVGFKFGTRKELIDKMSKAGFDKYPSYLAEPHKLAKLYNIKTKPSSNNKTHFLYDIPNDKKLSSILETIESNPHISRSGAYKKAQEILNNPKLKKEFIEFGSQQGVTGKQIREKYNLNNADFFQGGLRDLFDKNFQNDYKPSVRPQTIERMKEILNNKNFNKLLNQGILPEHEDLKKIFNLTPHESSNAILRIGQAFTGQKFENIEDLNIPLNKKAGKVLLEKISNAPFGNAYASAARTAVLNKIDSQMGNKTGTFDSFRKTIINSIKDNGLDNKLLKNFDLNEITGVSATAKNKMAPYAYFVNLVDSKINQGELASFNNLYGRKTNELIKAVAQSKKTGDDTKVKEVLDSFEESKNTFLDNISPKAKKEIERVGLPGLSVNSPEIEFGKRRINQLSKLGLNLPETFEKTGVTMTVPKGSFTLQDLKNNPKALTQIISSIGCPQTEYADGGRVNFSEGSNCYIKGIEKLQSEEPLAAKEINAVKNALQESGVASSEIRTLTNLAKQGGKNLLQGFDELMIFGRSPIGRLAGYGLGIGLPAYSAAEEALKGNYKQMGRELGNIPTLGFGLPESWVGSNKGDLINHAKEKGLDDDAVERFLNKSEISKKINDAEELLNMGSTNEKFIKSVEDRKKSLYDEYNNIKLSPADIKNFNTTLKSFTEENYGKTLLSEEMQKNKTARDVNKYYTENLDPDFISENKIKISPNKTETPLEDLSDYSQLSMADGGRVKLEGGGGPKMGRRGFLGLLAGTAALPKLIEELRIGKIAPEVKALRAAKLIPKVSGMPEWFPSLVAKIEKEGKYLGKDTGLVDNLRIKELTIQSKTEKGASEVYTMIQHPNGDIVIEANVKGGAFDAPFELHYTPPSSDINEATGKVINYPGDFSIMENRPRSTARSHHDADYEIDYDLVPHEQAISDIERVEQVATGKRVDPKRIEQRTAARKYIEENPYEDIVNRYGDIGETDWWEQ